MLSDIQNARIIDRDVSENIHLTIISLSRQSRTSPNETTHPLVAQTSNQPEETDSNTDTKPATSVKADPDGTIPLSVFGDAYADLIATKVEPREVSPDIEMADVRTLGMIIKPQDDQWSGTVCTIDPGCVLHSTNIEHDTALSSSICTTLLNTYGTDPGIYPYRHCANYCTI